MKTKYYSIFMYSGLTLVILLVILSSFVEKQDNKNYNTVEYYKNLYTPDSLDKDKQSFILELIKVSKPTSLDTKGSIELIKKASSLANEEFDRTVVGLLYTLQDGKDGEKDYQFKPYKKLTTEERILFEDLKPKFIKKYIDR